MYFFLAFRNIAKNRKNSLIIVILISVITFIFFTGNSIIFNADNSIRKAYIESLTGDVLLQKNTDVTMNLFGANTPVIDSLFTIPVLPAYDIVSKIVINEPGITEMSSQVSGRAYMDLLDIREPVFLCGVDAGSYFSLFPGILLEEGRFLLDGEFGAMITVERARGIEKRSGQVLSIGMPLLFTSGGAMGFKIREVPLVGIFRYQNPGHFMNDIVIIDPQTVRILNSIQVADASNKEVSEHNLISVDFDDIFNETFVISSEIDNKEFSVEMLKDYLSTDIENTGIGGDWNFILLRLNKGISSTDFIASLNKKIEPYGVTAVNWRIAAGHSAILILLIQALFNAGISIVCIVGVIGIINILLISVFRRVREIGTLRTIGASDQYIRSLIYCENIFISILAGLTGVFLGYLFLNWMNSLGLNITNELLVIMLNGNILQVEYLPHISIFSFSIAVLLGVISTVYPVELAVRFEPMEAVRKG